MTAPPQTASTALVCIDMQNDFALPGAPLCVAGAMACLPKVQEAIAMARQRGIPVIWVVREHDCYGVDVERTRAHLFNGPGTGATIAGTDGAKLVQGLEVMEGERVVIKRRFSAFFQTPLDSILRRLRVEKLVLCGIQTPNCIRTAAYDGICLDYDVLVLSDATASKTPEVQEANMQDMRDAGIRILTVEEWAARAKDHA